MWRRQWPAPPVLMAGGYRYVALVATARPSLLHATDAGRPTYARMGYEPVASHTAFIEKRFLDGR